MNILNSFVFLVLLIFFRVACADICSTLGGEPNDDLAVAEIPSAITDLAVSLNRSDAEIEEVARLVQAKYAAVSNSNLPLTLVERLSVAIDIFSDSPADLDQLVKNYDKFKKDSIANGGPKTPEAIVYLARSSSSADGVGVSVNKAAVLISYFESFRDLFGTQSSSPSEVTVAALAAARVRIDPSQSITDVYKQDFGDIKRAWGDALTDEHAAYVYANACLPLGGRTQPIRIFFESAHSISPSLKPVEVVAGFRQYRTGRPLGMGRIDQGQMWRLIVDTPEQPEDVLSKLIFKGLQ